MKYSRARFHLFQLPHPRCQDHPASVWGNLLLPTLHLEVYLNVFFFNVSELYFFTKVIENTGSIWSSESHFMCNIVAQRTNCFARLFFGWNRALMYSEGRVLRVKGRDLGKAGARGVKRLMEEYQFCTVRCQRNWGWGWGEDLWIDWWGSWREVLVDQAEGPQRTKEDWSPFYYLVRTDS